MLIPRDAHRSGASSHSLAGSIAVGLFAAGIGIAAAILPLAALGQTRAENSIAPSPGLRRLSAIHLTLLTDLPPSPAIDELPAVFDQAIGQWCEFFDVPRAAVEGWHVRGYLMGQRERFRQAGLLPDDLPPFPHGFQRGGELWVQEQPSDYYRRHLLLHEGTHAFMARWLGGTGPAWYREGMAELLATHRYDGQQLVLGVIPRTKEDVPDWGRILLVRRAVDEGKVRSFDEVMALAPREFSEVEAYAWSWAATVLLHGHPQWQDRFRGLIARASLPPERFARHWTQDLAPDRAALEQAWQIMIHHLDYSYDVSEDQVIERPERDWDRQATIRVDSRRGWQSSGLRLEPGRAYRLTAKGRFQINARSPAWFSEAGGITIEYYRGRPLGILLAAVRPDDGPEHTTALLAPDAVGLERVLEPRHAGVLFLRINEPAGRLADNQGELLVRVEAIDRPSGGAVGGPD